MEKAIIIDGHGSHKLNDYLEDGWIVKLISSQHIATGTGSYSAQAGGFLVIIEKNEKNLDSLS